MSEVTQKIHVLSAALDIAKQKASLISKEAARTEVDAIIRKFVQLRGHNPNESNNIFDVLESALLTEDESFAEKLRQVLLLLGDRANANRVMAMIWRERANGFRKEGRFEDAVSCGQEALHLYPDFPDALNELGLSYDKLNHTEKAIRYISRAIKLDPEMAFYGNLVSILEEHGRSEEALEYLNKAIKLRPNEPELYFLMGNIYSDTDFTKAEENYRRAISLNPDKASYHFNLAALHVGPALLINKNINLVVEEIKEAIRCQPKNPFFHEQLGFVLFHPKVNDDDSSKLRWIKEAASSYRTAIQIDPNNPDYYVENSGGLALCLYKQSELEDNNQVLQNAIETCKKGKILYEVKQNFEMSRELNELLNHWQSIFHFNNGKKLFYEDRWYEAEKQFQDAVELDSNHYSPYIYLSAAISKQARYKEALKIIEVAKNIAERKNLSKDLVDLAKTTELSILGEEGIMLSNQRDYDGVARNLRKVKDLYMQLGDIEQVKKADEALKRLGR